MIRKIKLGPADQREKQNFLDIIEAKAFSGNVNFLTICRSTHLRQRLQCILTKMVEDLDSKTAEKVGLREQIQWL